MAAPQTAPSPDLQSEAGRYRPILPNVGSPDQTLTTLRIDLHYAKLGILTRWDWRRYCRLAEFLGVTTMELGSQICLRHRRVLLAEKRNEFDGCACLLLTLLEAQAMKDYANDLIPNPFLNDLTQAS